jgi:hypothetical protein
MQRYTDETEQVGYLRTDSKSHFLRHCTMPEHATVVVTPSAARRQHRVDHWFYIGIALFVILLSVVGFGPSIIDQSRRTASLSLLVIVHGIAAGAWLLLFLTQAILVATKRIAVHRRLGLVGLVLALTMIVLVYLVSIEEFRRGYDLSGDLTRVFISPGLPLTFSAEVLFVPLGALFNFGVLVGAGLWWRHRPDIHKRLMLLAVLGLAREPVLHLVGYLSGHWPSLRNSGGLLDALITILLLSVSAIYDRVSLGRIHPVSVWVPILLIAWRNSLQFVLPSSTAWHEFTAWLIR